MAWNTIAAELAKLRTLPAVLVTVGVTVLAAAALGAALAAAPSGQPLTATEAALRTAGYTQTGLIVLGVLAIASEYAGTQARTSLTAVPVRSLLIAGKIVAYLVAAAVTALLALSAALAGALLTGLPMGGDGAALPRAAAYLVLIGLLALAVATLTRDAIAALATTLGLVLVLPPVLANAVADYLPGSAGARMYQPGPGLTPQVGALVLAAWLAVALAAAILSFTRRDA
ncbi:ABC transporter permease [Nonomuraea insulae]|uniref:ABC transporter permease n=1 Tax=Nonomuraea insulae TaxID=1616787 RepID=A0ABW1DBI3_9ACTN